MGDKQGMAADEQSGGWESQLLLTGRVGEVRLRPVTLLAADDTLADAAHAMARTGSSCVLVSTGGAPGVLTSTDLRDALAIGGHPPDAPLASLTSAAPISIGADEPLLQALIDMDRHRVRRLLVTDDRGQFSGVLEQADLLGQVADHSQAIALRIARAGEPGELRPAYESLLRLIALLHRKGMRATSIAQLASDVHAALFRRAFDLVMPEPVRANSCFVTLGSAGRGEQVLPTDQDNALILRDGFEHTELAAHCRRLSDVLIQIGYPACPGEVMVRNPAWVMSQSAFRARVLGWVRARDNESVMNLAIFIDAAPTGGDAALLGGVRSALDDWLASGGDAFFATFASAIVAFSPPLRWFSRLHLETSPGRSGLFDLKKGGVFPLVHGVRSLALEKRVTRGGTLARIERLRESGALDPPSCRNVTAAFEHLCGLRLSAGLEALARGEAATNYLRPDTLPRIDQDMLRDSLRAVMQFRRLVSQHFRLEMLGI